MLNFDINTKNEKGYSLLHLITLRGDIFFTKLLIENGANVNLLTNDGQSALELACYGGYSDVAMFLIEKGADVTFNNSKSLFFATDLSNDLTKRLIEKGANVNCKHPSSTPLHNAVQNGSFEIVKLLIENNADINAQDRGRGWTALMDSVPNNYIEIENFLLKCGADVNIKCDKGYTYAHYKELYKNLKSYYKEKI